MLTAILTENLLKTNPIFPIRKLRPKEEAKGPGSKQGHRIVACIPPAAGFRAECVGGEQFGNILCLAQIHSGPKLENRKGRDKLVHVRNSPRPSSGSGNVLPALTPEMMDPGDLHPMPQSSRLCKGLRALGKSARPLVAAGLQTTVPELDYMKT